MTGTEHFKGFYKKEYFCVLPIEGVMKPFPIPTYDTDLREVLHLSKKVRRLFFYVLGARYWI